MALALGTTPRGGPGGGGHSITVRAENCPSFEDLFSFQTTEPSLSPSASVHERTRVSLSHVM